MNAPISAEEGTSIPHKLATRGGEGRWKEEPDTGQQQLNTW